MDQLDFVHHRNSMPRLNTKALNDSNAIHGPKAQKKKAFYNKWYVPVKFWGMTSESEMRE